MRNIVLYMASALLLLTACNSGDEGPVADMSQCNGIPIHLRAGVENMTRASSGLQNSQFEKGAAINVYLKEITIGGQTVTTKYSPLVYTTTNASGALSPQSNTYPYFPTNGRGITVLAIYPTAVNNGSTTFSVEAEQKTNVAYKASDLMVATDTIPSPTSQVQTLQFKHLMTKISIQVVSGTGSPNIKNSSVTLYNVYRDIYFSGVTGQLGDVHGSRGTIAVTDDCSTQQSCIIPPQDIDPCRFFRIRLANRDVIYYYSTQTLNFKSGHEYKFVITVNQNSLDVTYTMHPWSDEEDGSNVVNTHANMD